MESVYYAAHFKELIEDTVVPPVSSLGNFEPKVTFETKNNVGLVWSTNADNPLSKLKSIDIELFECLKSLDVNFYSLQPKINKPDWIKDTEIQDLYDTARFIQAMDAVISVDTVTLHLAGTLGCKTLGLLHDNCDPRWGSESSTCWYPSVELFRQDSDGWENAISNVRDRLASLLSIM